MRSSREIRDVIHVEGYPKGAGWDGWLYARMECVALDHWVFQEQE